MFTSPDYFNEHITMYNQIHQSIQMYRKIVFNRYDSYFICTLISKLEIII